MDELLLLPILLPMIGGAILLMSSFWENLREAGTVGKAGKAAAADKNNETRPKMRAVHAATMTILSVSAAAALILAWTGERSLTLFTLLQDIPVFFRVDAVSRLFVTVVSVIWLAAGIYAFVYMRHEGREKRFFGFYLLLYGVLVALDFAGNLVTFYLCYEFVTLLSFPLVLHSGTREAVMAALKYLFYSMCGAYGGLFGIFFLNRYCDSLSFTPGGTLGAMAAGHQGILLTAVFVMLLGFGAKAGMLPLHAWLPTAHPVAPSPASAVLSAIIVKAGVLAVIRVVFYLVGPEFIRGTWVQYAWMTLALITVFMGSMLAYREKVFKKRLAYSTVSQVSYILFGLSLLNAGGLTGALLHFAGHAVIKCGLFLTAGVFLYKFGYARVDQLTGMGKKMPVTMWCYTIFSLGLIGIPPTIGFVSKWHLAEGALQSGKIFGALSGLQGAAQSADIGAFSWIGPAVLLVSALLTAGYLLPIVLKGFFPGEEAHGMDLKREEPSFCMLMPLVVLAALTLLLGIFSEPLIRYAEAIAGQVLP